MAEDANAVYWNSRGKLEPASIITTRPSPTASTTNRCFYDYLAYAQPVDTVIGEGGRRRGTVPEAQPASARSGPQVLYLNAGSLNEALTTPALRPDRASRRRISPPWSPGARRLTRSLDVGIGAKYTSRVCKIEEAAQTGAVDFAARLHLEFAEMPWVR